jgi:hypothetical protein
MPYIELLGQLHEIKTTSRDLKLGRARYDFREERIYVHGVGSWDVEYSLKDTADPDCIVSLTATKPPRKGKLFREVQIDMCLATIAALRHRGIAAEPGIYIDDPIAKQYM